MIKIEINGEALWLKLTHYQYGMRHAIQLFDNYNYLYAVLTCNIPKVTLQENEFLVKTWSENEKLVEKLRKLPYFINTGNSVPAGYSRAEIWKFSSEAIIKEMEKD